MHTYTSHWSYLAMRHSLLLRAAPFVFFAASACAPARAAGGANAAALPPVQVTVTATDDLRFTPSTISVKAGQPLQVNFRNGGQIMHDFSVQQGLATPAVMTEDGGKSGVLTVTFDEAGTYKFFCSQPGHDAAGMHGSIKVQ